MNYTGKLRIATGIAFLHAFTETVDNAGFTKTREPTMIYIHGDTNHLTVHTLQPSASYMETRTVQRRTRRV